MKKITIALSLAAYFSAAFLNSNAHAQGFDDNRIVELLNVNSKKLGLTAAAAIEAAQDAVANYTITRFIITLEGELMFFDDKGQLFIVVGVPAADENVRVILCRANIKALRARTAGIAAYADEVRPDDAINDNFEFIFEVDPAQALEDFLNEYEVTKPSKPKRHRIGPQDLEPTIPSEDGNFRRDFIGHGSSL